MKVRVCFSPSRRSVMSATQVPQNQQPSSAAPGAAPPNHGPLGRFASGNKAGNGNPFARQVAQLKVAVLKFMTEDKLAKILEAVFAQACEGNLAAARLLLQYSLGQPSKAVEPDRLDNEEWKLLKE